MEEATRRIEAKGLGKVTSRDPRWHGARRLAGSRLYTYNIKQTLHPGLVLS